MQQKRKRLPKVVVTYRQFATYIKIDSHVITPLQYHHWQCFCVYHETWPWNRPGKVFPSIITRETRLRKLWPTGSRMQTHSSWADFSSRFSASSSAKGKRIIPQISSEWTHAGVDTPQAFNLGRSCFRLAELGAKRLLPVWTIKQEKNAEQDQIQTLRWLDADSSTKWDAHRVI